MLKDAKQYEKAEEWYQQAITLYRGIADKVAQSETLFALGNMYRSLDKRSGAKECYEQAIQSHPRNWDAMLALGLLHIGTEPHTAQSLFEQALGGEPVHQITAYAGLAVGSISQGEMTVSRSEITFAQQLLDIAEAQHTVPKSQQESLHILLSGFENTTRRSHRFS